MSGHRWAWAVVGFGLLVGCEQPAQPRQQHRELRRINSEGVYLVPRVTDKSPIRFGHASVEVVGPNNSTLGSRSSWEPTVPAEAFVKHFLPEVAKASSSRRARGRRPPRTRCSRHMPQQDRVTQEPVLLGESLPSKPPAVIIPVARPGRWNVP
jgi:hypothetical protein